MAPVRPSTFRQPITPIVIAVVLIALGYLVLDSVDRPEKPLAVGAGNAPGYDDDGGALDTTPFTLPGSPTDGSTTNPAFDVRNGTTTPASTTTTLPPPPEYVGEDLVCGAFYEVVAVLDRSSSLREDPVEVERGLITYLGRATDKLVQTGQSTYQPMITLLTRLRNDVGAASSVDELTDLLLPFERFTSPELQSAAAPLIAHAEQACPDLVAR